MSRLVGESEGPIVVVPYDPQWPPAFEAARDRILGALPAVVRAMEHCGSTAVPGLAAKPIIDIVFGVDHLEDVGGAEADFEKLGYERVPWVEALVPELLYFGRGQAGVKSFHLHVVEIGSQHWEEPLLFRDWMRTHPEDAQAYAKLKRALAEQFPGSGEEYRQAKSGFVASILEKTRTAPAQASL